MYMHTHIAAERGTAAEQPSAAPTKRGFCRAFSRRGCGRSSVVGRQSCGRKQGLDREQNDSKVHLAAVIG